MEGRSHSDGAADDLDAQGIRRRRRGRIDIPVRTPRLCLGMRCHPPLGRDVYQYDSSQCPMLKETTRCTAPEITWLTRAATFSFNEFIN